jgi:acetyl esterase/lipase
VESFGLNASNLYLAVSLIGAGLTLLAINPGPRKGLVPGLFFAVGLMVCDHAFLHVAWQFAATVGFAAAGAFDAWTGWLGLSITLASWVGLWRSSQRARRAAPVLEEALIETLGPDYRAQIAPTLADHLVDASVRPWSRPFRLRHPEVERISDIAYGPHGERNLLDVYRPKSGSSGCPVLVYIHGGAWVMGAKDHQGLPLMHHLASKGWVCVAPNYRLGPDNLFPNHLIDVKRAIAWVKEHGREYGADPDWIAVSGGSAGGHLAALVGLTENVHEYQPGFEDVDTSVQAVAPLYGAYDLLDRHAVRPDRIQIDHLEAKVLGASPEADREAWEKFSPYSWVRPDVAPFFVIHGRNDSLLFHEDSAYFVEALRKASSQPVIYALLPGAQHAFDIFRSARSAAVVSAVARFLAWARSTGPVRKRIDV